MKKSVLCLISLSLLFSLQINAQNYNAYDYWKMEHDSIYNALKIRQNKGDTLSISETEYILNHKSKLDGYFNMMPDNEKSLYFRYRSSWENQPEPGNKIQIQEEPEIFLGEKSTFSKYMVSSGFFGFYYGLAAVNIFGKEDKNVGAIPLLTAGASILIPLLSINPDKATYSSLKLSTHGKTIGLLHGAAMAMIFSGKDGPDGNLMLGLSTVGSIGLGWLGYRLGKELPVTPGNAALYSFYGTLMPFEAAAIAGALNTEDQRVIGFSILAGGAGGYLLANQVSNKFNFTPGDVRSTKAFTLLNAMLGIGIMADIAESSNSGPSVILLIPVATTLGGTYINHYWLKDAKMTSQQGRNTALAAGAGALMGFGVATLFQTESATPYYLLPYASGLASYAIMVNICKRLNQQRNIFSENDNKFKIDFMPQGILLNQKLGKINGSVPGRLPLILPVVSASYKF